MTERLTAKQERFVREYLIDLNATQAAIRAGYSHGDVGRQLLAKTHVQEAIQQAMSERAKRTRITADRVVKELALLALYDPANLGEIEVNGPEDIKNLPEEVRRVIVGWGWDKQGRFTLKLGNKLGALTKLGEHLGIFKAPVTPSDDPLLDLLKQVDGRTRGLPNTDH